MHFYVSQSALVLCEIFSMKLAVFFLQLTLVHSATTRGCKLPKPPANGRWSVLNSEVDFDLQPGHRVPYSTALHVTCDENYKLLGTQLGLCGRDGRWEWQAEMGYCSKLCPPMIQTEQVKISCTFLDDTTGDVSHIKCSEAPHGAVAQFECAQYYGVIAENATDDVRSGGYGLSRCQNGEWSVRKPRCNPNCGVKSVNGVALSVNSTTAIEGSYPWQVALYILSRRSTDDFEFFCGGSLISEQVVVTAAHCVTTEQGEVVDPSFITIGAGNHHRNYKDARDPEAQFFPALKIHVAKNYKGQDQNFFGDIALVVTGSPFTLRRKVQPICVDWNKKYKTKFFRPSNKGYVSGWGVVSEQGNETDELHELEVPYVENEECSKSISESDRSYLTSDKLCLGYVNKSKSVCAGDSGGALVFKNNFDNRHYLTGIVSISPDTQPGHRCNSQLYSLYTEVYQYLDFIRETAAEFQSPDASREPEPLPAEISTTPVSTEITNCSLPEGIENGTIKLVTGKQFDGEVEPLSVLETKCNPGFELVGPKLNLCLGQAGKTWENPLASCSVFCPRLYVFDIELITCTKKTKIVTCNRAVVNGTSAVITCRNGKLLRSSCKDGYWDPWPDCFSDCGRVQNKQTDQLPWLAALFAQEKNETGSRFICGGTIVDKHTILTAAHCVSDPDGGRVNPAEQYTVAIGSTLQKRLKIERIIVPRFYRGNDLNFLSDMAALRTEEFPFADDVQPICVDWTNSFEDIEYKIVSGWGSNKFGSTLQPEMKLKILKLPYIPITQCSTAVEISYERYLTPDKFCLGLSNDTNTLCTGDGGNGVFSQNPKDGRYYLSAISSVNLGPDCGNYTAATRVSSYIANLEATLLKSHKSYLVE